MARPFEPDTKPFTEAFKSLPSCSLSTFHVRTSYKTGGLLTEEIQSWLFVQCYVPIDRGIQFALRKMIACKNWSQRRISAKLKSHLKFPHIHFVRIRKNVNIYFFVSTLNKEINIYACIYAYKWMCTWLEALVFLFI